ncbi:MAG: molybdopterin oxidoreductase [Phototrophicales bacterium]|nr:MAG: molybdopterin oxidoreductase [Phototrophicales bacterium]
MTDKPLQEQIIEEQEKSQGVSRRDFLKTSAVVTGATAFLGGLPIFRSIAKARAQGEEGVFEYPLAEPANQIYTVCLQCNTGCGIKVRLLDGVAAKIDGSPFHPMAMYPHIPYETPVAQLGTTEGAICPKGQAGLQSVYDPYRLVSVLKRKPGTKRGAGEWITISFDQAIEEIVEGGDLFGEGYVPGLRESYALRDEEIAEEMDAAIKEILAEKDTEAKQALVEAFKERFADYLDVMIDPDHPDFGPKNNQFVFAWGRLKNARKDFIKRFLHAYGTNNAHGHTTVCQGSLYFTGKAMSEQYVDGKWQGGSKFYWQGDVGNSKFIIFVGASPFEGNYGPPLRSPRIVQNMLENGTKIVVVDPRFSKTAAKAWKWLPGKPGTEAALAMAMIQWIIAQERYNPRYLAAVNEAAAQANGDPTWTEAAWLVKIDEEGNPTTFLRASEIGLRDPEERPKSSNPDETYMFDYFVTLVRGEPTAFDPYDQENSIYGDLLVDTEIEGIRVKSALQIIFDAANQHTLEEWAEICGLDVQDIIDVAFEFTNHGTSAVADIHRGVSQHTNGFYNVYAWYTLNALIGNYDRAGGLIKASTYKADGSKPGQPFKIKESNGDMHPFGLNIIRFGEKYENSTLFARDGYPAKRNWYPLASDIYQEIIPSIGDAYPYAAKALMLYMGSPVYALPAGHTNIEILADPKKLPLFICIDPFIGETSMYADYIFPDTMYMERWEFQGSHPSVPFKIEAVRNPAIDPLVPDVTVFGQQMPMSLEAVLMAIAERLELPAFGEGGFGEYGDFTHPDQLYIKMVANLAYGEKAEGADSVPDADDEELRIFLESRRHLRPSVFDPQRWEAIAGDMWRKVVYVLNRGGRFEPFSKGYTQGVFPEEGPNTFGLNPVQVAHPFGTLINIYQEKTYSTKSPITGEHLVGYPHYRPAGTSLLGEPLNDEAEGYDLHLITHREIMQTKSRTASNYWLLALLPENSILIHPDDAKARGLKDGDLARIRSASNPEGVWDLANGRKVPMVGKVKLTQGIRPGVISFALGFGHWSYGGVDFKINGELIKGDERRIRGIHANAAMRIDPYLGNTTLVDPVGASAVFYDTKVKLTKED